MPNSVLNSVNILYTPNIEDVKKYNKYASPNTFVVSSYYNPGAYVGFDYYYQGISYELYYIDHNRNINQLTYNMVPGNGLSIKDNKFDINFDNNTLKLGEFSSTNFAYININAFKEASYLNRGLLSINNDIYYNDKYNDTIKIDGSIRLNNNKIDLSNGLKHDLQNISKYSNKCTNLINSINNLYQICLKELNIITSVKVGDILYYNTLNEVYTLLKTDKSGRENVPVMVCVIASNILPDNEPRFMPLKRKMNQYIFDDNSSMYIKNSSNQIPIYNTNNLNQINLNTNIIGSYKGYIAVKRNSWKNNIRNPFNSSENYYALNDKVLVSKTSQEISKQNIIWYINSSKIDYNTYEILPEGIYTDSINEKIQETIEDSIIYIILTVKFNNNQIKYYICPLILKDNHLINLNTIYAYKLKKTITNNIKDAVSNIYENYVMLLEQDTLPNSSDIKYTDLETVSVDFNESDETYVISDSPEMLIDTTVKIVLIKTQNNKSYFSVYSDISGKMVISTDCGTLNKSEIVSDGFTHYQLILTNNSKTKIYPTIKINFIPDDIYKYKTASITYKSSGITGN